MRQIPAGFTDPDSSIGWLSEDHLHRLVRIDDARRGTSHKKSGSFLKQEDLIRAWSNGERHNVAQGE